MSDAFAGTPPGGSLPTAGSSYDERLALLDALRELHDEVTRLTFPPIGPGVTRARAERQALLALLDGYVVGRLHVEDRPLLAVIGGPTGAGKSTILNSLVGATVSPSGVLRPTTRTPVLLFNPVDERAVRSRRLLPGLENTTLRDDGDAPGGDDAPPRQLRLAARAEIPPGLAVLDSPDLDSWLSTNREVAIELLGVADLWILATTGTDYADAVPWDLLDATAARQVTVAAVLNRMRPAEVDVVRKHFAQMLTRRGLASTPVFTVPELTLTDERIPYQYIAQLHNWLSQQSGIADRREAYLDRALHGTLEQVLSAVRRLADLVSEQTGAARRARVELATIFTLTRQEVRAEIISGSLARDLRPAWDSVGELATGGSGRIIRRLGAALRPVENPYAAVGSTLRASITSLLERHLARGLQHLAERWTDWTDPAAPGSAASGLAGMPRTFAGRADAVVVSWLGGIEDQLRARHDQVGHAGRWSPETLAVASLAVGASAAVPGVRIRGDELEPLTQDLLTRLDLLIGEEEQRLGAMLQRLHLEPDDGLALGSHLEILQHLRTALIDLELGQPRWTRPKRRD